MRVLGIETSCDETGVAIYDSEQGLLGDTLYSQVKMHAEYGGVVPELASRDHVRKLIPLIRETFQQAGLEHGDVDAIAYTAGPGLIGALMVGASTGRALALAWDKPAIAVHHMEGHLLAPMLEDEPPSFPFVALLVSGGHTQLVRVDGIGQYELLGESLDDAAGEAFDKAAKMLGLDYPGVFWIAFGWGGRSFYIETPTWGDLKPGPVIDALTWDASVMHVRRTGDIPIEQESVRVVELSQLEFGELVNDIRTGFQSDGTAPPSAIPGVAYDAHDIFFPAVGGFNAMMGCNTWTADMLRRAGMKTGMWTPLPLTLDWSLDLHNGR